MYNLRYFRHVLIENYFAAYDWHYCPLTMPFLTQWSETDRWDFVWWCDGSVCPWWPRRTDDKRTQVWRRCWHEVVFQTTSECVTTSNTLTAIPDHSHTHGVSISYTVICARSMHCNLKAARRRTSCSGLFLANFVLHMRINCYLPASNKKNSHRY